VPALLKLSRLIDAISEFIGRWVAWLVLLAVLISAINAVIRKAFDMSSNAFLEIQWYLFAAIFLLAAGYTMLRQEHVKIDVILHRFTRATQVKIEIFGIVAFLFPFVFAVVDLVLPLVIRAYTSGEMSSNAGGLIRWPVFALVPVGFALLGLQGVSELIKRIAFLKGLGEDPGIKKQQKTAEQELAEAILAQTQSQAQGAKP
jgi:TRAP-type mannitol/chloroaromatic compound transport system permease small subunit